MRFRKKILPLGVLWLLAAGCAVTPTKPRELIVNTQPPAPQPYRPHLKVEGVYGDYSDITSVKVKIPDVALELDLKSIGDRTWSQELSPTEIQLLLQSKERKEHPATIWIQSQNSKGLRSVRKESAQVIVQNLPMPK